MGTTSVQANNTELVIQKIGEVLGAEGAFEKRKIQLRNEYGPIIAAAKKITAISNADDAQEASNAGRVLRAGKRDYEIAFKTVKSAIDDLKRPILAEEKEAIAPFDSEGNRLGSLVQTFQQEQERIRQEEERKARLEAEARARAEEDRLAAEAREAALIRAIALEAKGDDEGAKAVMDEPIYIEPVSVEPVIILSAASSKPKGTVTTTRRWAEVENFKELVAAVVAGKVPLRALLPNQPFLDNEADNLDDAFAIPGCKLKKETKTHFRS